MSFYEDCLKCGGGPCQRTFSHGDQWRLDYDRAVLKLLNTISDTFREGRDPDGEIWNLAARVRELRLQLGRKE